MLHRFGAEVPELFQDAATEVAEIETHAIASVDHETSVK